MNDNIIDAANFIQNDGLSIASDEFKARDSGGLKLYNASSTGGLFVDNAGNIGIGTSSPNSSTSSKLHITKDISLTNDNMGLWFNTYFDTQAKGYSNAYGGAILAGKSDDGKLHVQWDDVTTAAFTPTSRIAIDSTGKIGIGTASPFTLLHIHGQAPNLVVRDEDADVSGRGDAITRISRAGAGRDKAQIAFEDGGTSKWM